MVTIATTGEPSIPAAGCRSSRCQWRANKGIFRSARSQLRASQGLRACPRGSRMLAKQEMLSLKVWCGTPLEQLHAFVKTGAAAVDSVLRVRRRGASLQKSFCCRRAIPGRRPAEVTCRRRGATHDSVSDSLAEAVKADPPSLWGVSRRTAPTQSRPTAVKKSTTSPLAMRMEIAVASAHGT